MLTFIKRLMHRLGQERGKWITMPKPKGHVLLTHLERPTHLRLTRFPEEVVIEWKYAITGANGCPPKRVTIADAVLKENAICKNLVSIRFDMIGDDDLVTRTLRRLNEVITSMKINSNNHRKHYLSFLYQSVIDTQDSLFLEKFR